MACAPTPLTFAFLVRLCQQIFSVGPDAEHAVPVFVLLAVGVVEVPLKLLDYGFIRRGVLAGGEGSGDLVFHNNASVHRVLAAGANGEVLVPPEFDLRATRKVLERRRHLNLKVCLRFRPARRRANLFRNLRGALAHDFVQRRLASSFRTGFYGTITSTRFVVSGRAVRIVYQSNNP